MESPVLSKAHISEEFITHDLEGSSQPYAFLNSIVVPRPIAFVTTKGIDGIVNAAPFSYFNAVSVKPTIISISIQRRDGERKDTARNIFSTKEFVINICSANLAKFVSQAAIDYPPSVSEIDLTGLSLIPSEKISTPRIANTSIQMECRFTQAVEIQDNLGDLILGEVVAVHLHKNILNEKGRVDFEKLNPLARLSGNTYAQVSNFFEA